MCCIAGEAVRAATDEHGKIDLAVARNEQRKMIAQFIRIDPGVMTEGAFR